MARSYLKSSIAPLLAYVLLSLHEDGHEDGCLLLPNTFDAIYPVFSELRTFCDSSHGYDFSFRGASGWPIRRTKKPWTNRGSRDGLLSNEEYKCNS